MCGILVSNMFVNESDFIRQFKKLYHRGPDAQVILRKQNWYIGHVRLSIIDTADRSNQPFCYENLVLVFNGEIYNYRELRAELENLGYDFQTDSDTEVVIKSFHLWGRDCLAKFEGMFALAVYNQLDDSWFGARDRIGQKPFYYYHDGNTLTISSEAKVFEGFDYDDTSLSIYYNTGYVPAPFCIYKGVSKLKPGHFIEFSNGSMSLGKYWELTDTNSDLSASCIDDVIKRAVSKRLRSDVPLSVFFSGGVDSTIIAKIAGGFGELTTFTARFSKRKYDESETAIAHNRQVKSTQHLIDLSDDSVNNVFNDFIEKLDEPFGDSSIIGTMVLCNNLPKREKVILTGDGGDESFFGYNHFRWLRLKLQLESLIPKILLRTISRFTFIWYTKTNQRKWLNISLLINSSVDDFIRYVFTGFTDLCIKRDDSWYLDMLDTMPKALNDFQRMADVNIKLWLEGDSCFKTDRGGMYYGKELRSPFLDHEVIERARDLSVEKRFSKKYLLKFASRIGLDIALFEKKRGFTMPIESWLEPVVRNRDSILWSFDYRKLPNFDEKKFFHFLEEFTKGNYSYKEEIWKIYVLVRWLEKSQY